MFFWFAGLSFVIVWQVFRDPAVDFRLVMFGSVVPDVVDAVFGGARVLHSLIGSVALLAIVMVCTRRRRKLRRRLLAVPIGTFLHLALDGMWTNARVFWWPFLGWSFHAAALPSIHRPAPLLAGEEAIGAFALGWCVVRFRLGEPERRRTFVRTGRLGRDVVR